MRKLGIPMHKVNPLGGSNPSPNPSPSPNPNPDPIPSHNLNPAPDPNPNQVNPLGGAIALGHPLGCTGARQVATLLHQMRRTGQRYGVVSMCIGTGMGAAAVFEAE